MATVLDIVNAAFREIGVKAEDEALTADQVANGVSKLNMMVAAWPKKGVIVTVAPLEAATVWPLPTWTEEPTSYCLAAKLAPGYSAPPVDADPHMRTLQAGYAVVNAVTMPVELLRMPSRIRR